MSSISNDDRRNRRGLAALRGRYVRRAKYLLGDLGSGLHEAVESARSAWNERYPQYRIIPESMPKGLEPSGLPTMNDAVFWPARYRDERRSLLDRHRKSQEVGAEVSPLDDPQVDRLFDIGEHWTRLVDSLCRQGWPPSYFPNPTNWETRHVAQAFISASLLFYSYSIKPDPLFPVQWFVIDPDSLEYPPQSIGELLEQARAVGERDAYRNALRDVLGDNTKAWQDVKKRAEAAGNRHAKERYPYGRWPGSDIKKHWWYVPVRPGASANDYRDSAAKIADLAEALYGSTPVDDLILTLTQRGLSQQRVANLIGVDRSQVTRVISESKRD